MNSQEKSVSVLQMFHSDEGGDTGRPRFDVRTEEGGRKPRRKADEERRLFRAFIGGDAGTDSKGSLKNVLISSAFYSLTSGIGSFMVKDQACTPP